VVMYFLLSSAMFCLCIRYLPRRRSQTVLIVLCFTLSTLIISAAFTTGDTVHRSITSEVYTLLGSLDETIHARGLNEEDVDQEDESTIIRDTSFSAQDGATIVSGLEGQPLIDAAVPIYADFAVGLNPPRRLSVRNLSVIGLDPDASRSLPDIETSAGSRVNVSGL